MTLFRPTLIPLLLAGGVLGVSASPTMAQESGGEEVSGSEDRAAPYQLGFFVGGNYLSPNNELGDTVFDDQVPGSGFLLGMRANYLLLDTIAPDSAINPHLRLELEAKYTFSSTEGGMGRRSVTTPVVGARGNLLIDLYPQNGLTPFALLGLGSETVFGTNLFMTSPDSDFATFVGAGVRYEINKDLEMRADLRLGSTASRAGSLSALFEVHAGFAYNFGTPSKPQEIEKKAEPVETPPKPQVLDSDRDGIADESDACPDLAEVFNEIDDEDGCPEVDSDHDGLLGSQDQCPAAAEDIDGKDDDDGCPDPDNDGDGRPDFIDQCPNRAENLNGFEDEDGCPDTIPERVKAFTGKIEGIQFKTGSARIVGKSKATLSAAFAVLKANPSVRIEISGHTDNQGDEQSNRDLARKRADYVKWYLADRGIDANRMEAVGHGSAKPIETNDTEAGRLANRRIEFRLLPGAATVAKP